MPTASGPCRFGQYSGFVRDLIRKLKIRDLAFFSPTHDNGYAQFGDRNLVACLWRALVLADNMQDVYSVLLTNAVDRLSALEVFGREWQRVLECLEGGVGLDGLEGLLEGTASALKAVPVKRSIGETPLILLTGEIYVRHDDLSTQHLLDRLADHGFAAKVASVMEYVYYSDWCWKNGLTAALLRLYGAHSIEMRPMCLTALSGWRWTLMGSCREGKQQLKPPSCNSPLFPASKWLTRSSSL